MWRPGRFGLFLIVVMLGWTNDLRAWAADMSGLRYAVEATYLYKFAPFVSWPPAADQGPMRLCIAGDDRVAALIPSAVQGQSVGGRPIVAQHLDPHAAPDGCAILYSAGAPAALSAARGKPILTVAEAGDDGDPQAIISLVVIGGHVRFDINEALAQDARLSISSKLLSLAHSVTPPAGGQK
jgi:hypothetical protein